MRGAGKAIIAAGFAAFVILPAFAQSAPPSRQRAGAFVDPDAMARMHSAMQKENGGGTTYYLLGDRFEYQTNKGAPLLFFGGEAWWGSDRDKLWIKTETEYEFEANRFREAEVQALWSRAISRYFDLQTGIRRNFESGGARTYGVLGIEGLAPYWFDIDAAMFVSSRGDISARFESEYELLLTQRLVLQPRVELNFAAQNVEELRVGSGLSTAEAGLRLRYEIRRQFAPYIGVSWQRSVGKTADFARADGVDPGGVSFVAGLRLWH
ncbi:MAG TPA: copper resistance protein B [Parvularculaceae bacterium]|nr:copper resistance protein B [Parvularculaceae bacterium]